MILTKNVFKGTFKLLPMLFAAIAFAFTFTSCEEDGNNVAGLTAIAGADAEVDVGSEVSLDASASIDITGSGYDVSWTFVSTPDGSTASIAAPASSTTSFTPDLVGDYVVMLTISNNLGSSSDEVTLTALASTVTIGGSYYEDLHLVNIMEDPSVPDYLVSDDVWMYAPLIIDPGVRIQVLSDRMFRVRSEGSIDINGTEQMPVIIEGQTAMEGFWKGLIIESNNVANSIEYLHLHHSGSSNIISGSPRSGLHVNSGRVTVINSTFSDIDGFGFSVRNTSSQFNMESLTFENNALGALSIGANHAGSIDNMTDFNGHEVFIQYGSIPNGADHEWIGLNNGSYRVTDDVWVYGALSISEGAQFAFENETILRVRSEGSLSVTGTESNPVVFKGNVDLPGVWKGIMIESNSLLNELTHVNIMHAGHSGIISGFGKTAVGVDGNSRLTLNNVTFSDTDGYGVDARYGGTVLSMNSCSFGSGLSEGSMYMNAALAGYIDEATDFGNNPIVINGGNIPQSSPATWVNPTNGKYVIMGDVWVYDRLQINPGATLEFDSDVILRVRSEGVLVAQGNSTDRITFTRISGSASYWKGIYYESSNVESVLDYCELSYAGNSDMGSGIGQANLGIIGNARITVTNSTISNSLGYGISVRSGAELTESGNTFTNNASGDISQ